MNEVALKEVKAQEEVCRKYAKKYAHQRERCQLHHTDRNWLILANIAQKWQDETDILQIKYAKYRQD